MLPKSTPSHPNLFFPYLSDLLDQKYPLYILANKIQWETFENQFAPLYCPNNGRPAKPIRLMCGLLILKHLRKLSDEAIVEQWHENAYYQYFCGCEHFTPKMPCDASDLVHFRHRIGDAGMELILQESIRLNDDDSNGKGDDTAFIDSTVQEKNVTYPTDAKLHKKIISKCLQIADKESLPLRRSYKTELKKLSRDQRFRNHPKNKKKALRADKRIRTIAGILLRELGRNLPCDDLYKTERELYARVLAQKKGDKNKIYSLHEPDVQCISKGKEHKKYEFGNKVSIIVSKRGVILGAKSFRNEYDGHTIEAALEQVKRLTGKVPKLLAGDRGYRGVKQSLGSEVVIPGVPLKRDSAYQKSKKHKLFCKRAGIEPVIGHVKNDHRLNRNFYKGLLGDAINVMLAAAAYNFKRALRLIWWIWKIISETLIIENVSLKYAC